MKEKLHEIGVNIGLLVAGFAGSLLTVKRDGHKDWFTTTTSLMAGTLSANYLTPIAVDIFSMHHSNTQYATAFMLGFLGLHGVEYAIGKLKR